MEKQITKKYSNGEVTVVWQPHKCIHSGNCFRGLPGVFDPRVRPWVKPEAATTQQIVEQVDKCPSGALSYFMNSEEKPEERREAKIEVLTNGPLVIYGNWRLTDKNGEQMLQNKTAFCRCGQSNRKPFCDGSHITNNFEG